MKPFIHCKSSVKRWGGVPEDYLDIHTWFDNTKGHIADVRHRAILHNAWGIWMSESIFGKIIIMPNGAPQKTSYIINSDGVQVQVRDIGEQHVIEDLGRIPSLFEAMNELPMLPWLGGPVRKKKTIKLQDIEKLLNNVD